MKKWILFFAAGINIILFSRCTHIQAQNIRDAFIYAGQLKDKGLFAEATDVYERILFFSEDTFAKRMASFNLGDSYIGLKEYAQAVDAFLACMNLVKFTDSLSLEAQFRRIACQLLVNDYSTVFFHLAEMKDSILTDYFHGKKIFYLAVVNFYINDFASSEDYFCRLFTSDSLLKNQVKSVFNDIRASEGRIKPRMAFYLNRLLPGAGHFYNGEIWKGVDAFLLNGLLVYATVIFAKQYTVVDAILFTGNWFGRYYSGGALQAQFAAQKKLENIRYANLSKLLALIENKKFP